MTQRLLEGLQYGAAGVKGLLLILRSGACSHYILTRVEVSEFNCLGKSITRYGVSEFDLWQCVFPVNHRICVPLCMLRRKCRYTC